MTPRPCPPPPQVQPSRHPALPTGAGRRPAQHGRTVEGRACRVGRRRPPDAHPRRGAGGVGTLARRQRGARRARPETCQEKNRWEFLLSLVPWRMIGVTSSAVNPVAAFRPAHVDPRGTWAQPPATMKRSTGTREVASPHPAREFIARYCDLVSPTTLRTPATELTIPFEDLRHVHPHGLVTLCQIRPTPSIRTALILRPGRARHCAGSRSRIAHR